MAENHTIRYTLDATDNASADIKKVGDAITNTGSAADSAGSDTGGMGKFKSAAIAVGTALLGMQIGDKIAELNQVGEAANKAQTTFTQLVGGTDQARLAMDALRNATSGAVDDLTLQQGANQMLVTGLAKNIPELEQLTELGVKLSGAMGKDATEGMENFALAMNNMSYERLDTLGISASNVRNRVAELKKEGYDTQEAFKMAVIEQGALTLERLGVAAEVGATGVSKLSTRLQNLQQDIGQGLNTTIEGAANSLNMIFEIGDMRQAQRDMAQGRAQEFVNEYQKAIEQYVAQSGADIDLSYVFGGRDGFAQALADVFKAVEQDPALKEDMEGLALKMLKLPEGARGNEAVQALADSLSLAFHDSTIQGQIKLENEALAEQEAHLKAINAQMEREKEHRADMWDKLRAYNDEQEQMNRVFEQFTSQYGELEGLTPLSEFMSAADAEEYTNRLAAAKDELELLKGFAEQDLISDAQLTSAESMVENLEDMAEQAEKAAAAFENIKLSDVFGQTGGGMQGEISDMILSQMQDAGATEEAIAAMQRALDLSSGRSTEGSLTLEEQIIPILAKLMPNQAAGQAANIEAYLQQMALSGAGQDEITAGLPFAGRFGSAWGSYDQKMIDMYGGTTGEGAGMSEEMQATADASIELNDNMEAVKGSAVELNDIMAGLTGVVHTIKANLVVEGLDKLLAALNAAGSGGSPVVPGDPRVGGRPGSAGGTGGGGGNRGAR